MLVCRKIAVPIALVALCAVLAGGRVSAAPSGGAVKDQLEQAKAVRTDARTKARAALIQAIDARIKAAGAAGDLDTLKVLTTQKDGFVAAGVLPNVPALKDATAQYTQSMHKADGAMVEAYETAIEAYTTQSKADEAMAVRKERHALLEGTADLPSPDSPETIGFLMERAKSDYIQAVGDAKKAFLQAIDARITATTDAGDLKAVTKLQAARAAAEADAPLAEGFTDSAVLSARAHYGLAIQVANQRLASAYRDTIRNYTRARAIDKAQATQAEFDATGLGAAPAAGSGSGVGPASDNSSKLSRILPPFLEATGAFSAEKAGIRPAKGVIIATRAADFLSKDFIFDVSVQVPKEEEWVVVGIGDKSEKGSMRVVIRDDGGWGRRAFLTHGDTWGQHIGDIHVSELYVIRLERHGGPITASVGSVTDGKFTADMSQTVSNVKAFVPDLTEKRSHLFFSGGVVYSQVRLATGAAAAASGGGTEAHSPMTPVKLPAAGSGVGGPGALSPPSPIIPGSTISPAAGSADTDAALGVYRLNTDKLPAAFEATGTFSVSSAGLKPYDGKCLIMTRAEDFLSKDFVFEANVDVPRKEDWIIMGLGDGTDKGSLRLVIRPDAGWGTRAFLTLGDQWGKHFGDIREAGPRVLRIEHHATSVTVAVGTEKNGKFEPEMSQTVADAKAAVGDLSERRARLFFTGKTTWGQIRLVTGDAAAAGVGRPSAAAPVPSSPVALPPTPPVAAPASPVAAAPGGSGPAGSIFSGIANPPPAATPAQPGAAPAAPLHTQSAGGHGGTAFEDLAAKDGALVGFTCLTGKFGGHTVIDSVEPIFMVTGQTTKGQRHGKEGGKSESVVAKPGYAVAGIVAKGGDRLDGFEVIFMRRVGNHLDPRDSYESDPIGGAGGSQHRLGCDGKLVIGIFGKAGKQLDALGLVQAP